MSASFVEQQAAAALEALGRPDRARSVVDLMSAPPEAFERPGLYSWWVDRAGADDLSRGLHLRVEPGLLYAGQAGATRAGGRASASTLRGRIVTMHLEGSRRFSTFRLSLGTTLDTAYGFDGGEDELSAWMYERLAVALWPIDDPDSLGVVEERVLAALDPPFNLRGMNPSPVRVRLTELRRAAGR